MGVPDRNIFIGLKKPVTVLGVSPVQPSDWFLSNKISNCVVFWLHLMDLEVRMLHNIVKG